MLKVSAVKSFHDWKLEGLWNFYISFFLLKILTFRINPLHLTFSSRILSFHHYSYSRWLKKRKKEKEKDKSNGIKDIPKKRRRRCCWMATFYVFPLAKCCQFRGGNEGWRIKTGGEVPVSGKYLNRCALTHERGGEAIKCGSARRFRGTIRRRDSIKI